MAAGFKFEPKAVYPQFAEAFAEAVAEEVGQNELCHKLYTDGPLNEDEFTFEVAEILRYGGPWGPGFPEPLFDGEFKLVNQRLVGRRHLKMVLQAPGSDQYLDAIAFNVDLNQWPNYDCRPFVLLIGWILMNIVAEKNCNWWLRKYYDEKRLAGFYHFMPSQQSDEELKSLFDLLLTLDEQDQLAMRVELLTGVIEG